MSPRGGALQVVSEVSLDVDSGRGVAGSVGGVSLDVE